MKAINHRKAQLKRNVFSVVLKVSFRATRRMDVGNELKSLQPVTPNAASVETFLDLGTTRAPELEERRVLAADDDTGTHSSFR